MKSPHDRERGPETLEVRHLRLARAIAAEQSVTRAAGRLHLSQSAVSHQLLDLESALGTRLFDRVGKRMVPTAAGARMVATAEGLLGELASLERALHDLRDDARTSLRITTSCYTSYHWLPAALARFGAQHPRVDLTIVLEATRRAQQALAADEVDLAIVTDVPAEPSWTHAPLVTSELVALVSPKHAALARYRVRPAAMRWTDLAGADVLVHDIGDVQHARLDRAVQASDASARVEVRRVPFTEALVELARAGSGIGVLDAWIARAHVGRDLWALPLVPRARRTFSAVWRTANPHGLPMRELVELIARTVAPLETAGTIARAAGRR